MKVLKIGVALTLALGLVLGIALPGLAAPNEAEGKAPPKMLRGKVVRVDGNNQEFFVIESRGLGVTISVNSDTQYFKAPIPQKAIALAQHRMKLRQPEEQERVRAMGMAIPMKLRAIERAPLLKRVRAYEKLARVRPFCRRGYLW